MAEASIYWVPTLIRGRSLQKRDQALNPLSEALTIRKAAKARFFALGDSWNRGNGYESAEPGGNLPLTIWTP
jgi:hypothetical protein